MEEALDMLPDGTGRVGIVAIGRNEAARLPSCLASARSSGARVVVYVDSGSVDGSPDLAREMACEVVELDPQLPFSAGRARNEGVDRLREVGGDLEFVQFLDADCELVDGWLARGVELLQGEPDVVAVCGQRREAHPDRSVYNLVTDIEWRRPSGDTHMFAGDALVRLASFSQAGGFRAGLIAGEEPELCVRLRKAGGRIVRLPLDMTRHDAAMSRFSQWWRRQVRSGHAYAEIAAVHLPRVEAYWVRRLASIAGWGALPFLAFLGAPFSGGWSLLLLALPLLLWLRVFRAYRSAVGTRPAGIYATACVLGKVAELQGVVKYAWRRLLSRRPSGLIEYKDPARRLEREPRG